VDGAVQHQQKLLGAERLVDVVERPQLHRLHRRVDGAEGGHHDELRVGLQRRRHGEHVHPVDAGEVQVQQHQVEELAPQPLQRRLAGAHHLHAYPSA
jgi:hypothetical protein